MRKSDIDNVNIRSLDISADEEMNSKERTHILEEAIKSLPEQQRAVFNMRYYDNLTYEEISSLMNKSTGGMKANYFHAVKKLGKFLKNHNKFEEIESN